MSAADVHSSKIRIILQKTRYINSLLLLLLSALGLRQAGSNYIIIINIRLG